VGGAARVTGTTASTSPATGALTVAGGAGVAGALNVGGAARVNDTTDSIGKDTGALVVEGGVGIEKNLNVGGNIIMQGNKVAVINTQSDPSATNLPIGSFVIARNSNFDNVPEINAVGYVSLDITYRRYIVSIEQVSGLAGTWRSCGYARDSNNLSASTSFYSVLMRRVL
jgi:hypothetical protein